MLLALRQATTEDAPFLVQLYDRAYAGGYSASFDRYGRVRPEDFWWIQSEKEVLLVDVDHRPAGLVIIGRPDGAMVVEEVVSDPLTPDREGPAARAAQAFVQRLGAYLLQRFRRERQERLLLRTAETNALGMSLARSLDLAFTNALVVSTLRPRSRGAIRAPVGYALRKMAAADTAEVVRIYRECYESAPAPAEIEDLMRRPTVRSWVAERDGYMVGFLVAEARKGGFGDLVVGIREAHRRRGVGRALATPALNFFAGKQMPLLGLHWGPDGLAQAYYRGLGFATERVYLFFEKSI